VPERSTTVVIGAGHAGLSVSRELERAGVDHVVLERGKVGQRWRTRWESFCLVTPNWTVQLPDGHYDGDDPDGFMERDEIVAFLERYAGGLRAPVHEGVEVSSLTPAPRGGFRLETSDGELLAGTVVVCSGAYQRPHRTPLAAALPARVTVIESDAYRSPADLPPGPVLVVGSGQTGCQLAEELHESGREVFLSCGRAPWTTRRIGDHDVLWWTIETGFLDAAVDSLPSPAARFAGNLTATGRFANDLGESIAWGDARRADLLKLVRKLVAERGLPEPELEFPDPPRVEPLRDLDLAGFGAVIVTAGFRPDYARWIHVPGAFDGLGFPVHEDGASSAARGLWFAGVHFLRKRKSALLYGVGEDAALVARGIAAAA
jgi:putative flavoprotein involved in K+ transport